MVDDDVAFLRVAKEALAGLGVLATFTSARAALEAAAERRPDVVVSEIQIWVR